MGQREVGVMEGGMMGWEGGGEAGQGACVGGSGCAGGDGFRYLDSFKLMLARVVFTDV